MKRFFVIALMLTAGSLYGQSFNPNYTDSLHWNTMTGQLDAASFVFEWTIDATNDTLNLPLPCQRIDIIPRTALATTDTLQIAYQGYMYTSAGVARFPNTGFSEFLKTGSTVFRDFGKPYIRRVIVKRKAGATPIIWIRAY